MCGRRWLDRSLAHKSSIRSAPVHHTPRYIPCGDQVAARSTNWCSVALNLRNVITVTCAHPAARVRAWSEKWLDRSLAHKSSIRPAPEHHTPRYIPRGDQVAAQSTNGSCTQPSKRHNRHLRASRSCVCGSRHQVAARWIVTRAHGGRTYRTACPHHP